MLFHLLLSLVAVTPALDSVESAWLDTALTYLNITRHDLEYPKIWVRDPAFLTTIARRALDHPLDAPSMVDSIEENVVRMQDDPADLTVSLAGLMNVNPRKAESGSEQPGDIPSPIPVELRGPLVDFIGALESANSSGSRAFVRLTEGEIDTLISDAVYWWSDEDDSLDDTLRGVLNRELGIPSPFPYRDTTSIPPESLRLILEKVDMAPLISGYVRLLKGVIRFVQDVRPVDSVFHVEFNSPIGRVCVGGIGDDRYRDCALVVDFGGNDIYTGRIGGGIWNPDAMAPGCGVVIDFSGDDVYLSDKVVSTGGGVMGYGLIYDLQGNDIYSALHVSMGAGILGCGGLIDLAGDDVYRGGFFVQGSGNFGVGFLIDRGGDDQYRAFDFAQGLGGVRGVGLLLDANGDDSYYAGGKYIHHPLRPDNYRSFAQGFAIGWRPDFAGGIGLLFDLKGNDSYYSEIYGQGVSYWLSFAALVDDSGDDSYYGIQYMQGAGIHLSTGILVDRGGDDNYFSRYGPSQGEGHDLAAGWLIDKSGDDRYFVSDGQGVGLTNSVGFFIDSGGDDIYSVQTYGEGWANWRRSAPGIGIFLELGGHDRYPSHLKGGDGKIWLSGTSGIGIDVETGN